MCPRSDDSTHSDTDRRHRGFAFVTYAAATDAQDAIDNMDLNVFRGKVIKVNIATSTKIAAQPAGNRAGAYYKLAGFAHR